MSKLSIIRKALLNDLRVGVSVQKHTGVPIARYCYDQSIVYHLYPAEAPIYRAHKLQQFMDKIVSSIYTQPSSQYAFEEEPNYLKLGFVDYHEEIGQKVVKCEIRITDPEVWGEFSEKGFTSDGTAEVCEKYAATRLIRLRLYPSREIWENPQYHTLREISWVDDLIPARAGR